MRALGNATSAAKKPSGRWQNSAHTLMLVRENRNLATKTSRDSIIPNETVAAALAAPPATQNLQRWKLWALLDGGNEIREMPLLLTTEDLLEVLKLARKLGSSQSQDNLPESHGRIVKSASLSRRRRIVKTRDSNHTSPATLSLNHSPPQRDNSADRTSKTTKTMGSSQGEKGEKPTMPSAILRQEQSGKITPENTIDLLHGPTLSKETPHIKGVSSGYTTFLSNDNARRERRQLKQATRGTTAEENDDKSYNYGNKNENNTKHEPTELSSSIEGISSLISSATKTLKEEQQSSREDSIELDGEEYWKKDEITQRYYHIDQTADGPAKVWYPEVFY